MDAAVQAAATLIGTCTMTADGNGCADLAYKVACSLALSPCAAGALQLHSEFCNSTCNAALDCLAPSPLCAKLFASNVCKAGYRAADDDATCVPLLLPFSDIVSSKALSSANVTAAQAQRCASHLSSFAATASTDVAARCNALRSGVPTEISSRNATNKLLLYDDSDVVILPTFASAARLAADTIDPFRVPALRVIVRGIQVSMVWRLTFF